MTIKILVWLVLAFASGFCAGVIHGIDMTAKKALERYDEEKKSKSCTGATGDINNRQGGSHEQSERWRKSIDRTGKEGE